MKASHCGTNIIAQPHHSQHRPRCCCAIAHRIVGSVYLLLVSLFVAQCLQGYQAIVVEDMKWHLCYWLLILVCCKFMSRNKSLRSKCKDIHPSNHQLIHYPSHPTQISSSKSTSIMLWHIRCTIDAFLFHGIPKSLQNYFGFNFLHVNTNPTCKPSNQIFLKNVETYIFRACFSVFSINCHKSKSQKSYC
jgi:hypothetical protein